MGPFLCPGTETAAESAERKLAETDVGVVGDPRGISVRELAMYAAGLLAIGFVGHRERKLMTMIEIIEAYVLLHFTKREHSWSLSRVGSGRKSAR